MTQLPPELFGKIISEIRNDRPALQACALASRCLIDLSHRHLFRHVLIRSPDQSNHILHKIGGCSSQFEELLKSSPHIGTYVRCLELFDWPRWYYLSTSSQGVSHWLPNDLHLPHCLPRLKNLEALVLTYRGVEKQDWKELPTPLLTALYDILRLPSLHYLDLEGSPTFALLHVAAKNVKHLTVYDPSGRSPDIENIGAHDEIVYIESLHITQACWPSILAALTDQLPPNVSMQRLKKLLVDLGDAELDDAHQVLATILQQIGGNVEELLLLPNPRNDAWSQHCNPIDLSVLKLLKRFRVRLYYEYVRYEPELDNIPWFVDFLKKSSGSLEQLETLDISVYYEPDSRRTVVDWLVSKWDELAEVLLDSKRFPSLKTVCMSIELCEMRREIWEATQLSKFVKTMRSSRVGFDLQYGFSNQKEFSALNPDWGRSLTRS